MSGMSIWLYWRNGVPATKFLQWWL